MRVVELSVFYRERKTEVKRHVTETVVFNARFDSAHPDMKEDWRYDIANESNTKCSNCGRIRMSLCLNGKHRCEKCDYSPEEKRVLTDEEIDYAYNNTFITNLSLIDREEK